MRLRAEGAGRAAEERREPPRYAGAADAYLSADTLRRRRDTSRRAVASALTLARRCAKAHPTLLVLLLLTACTRGSTSSNPPIHLNPNMDDQPRYEAQASSDFFADGKAMRTPVPGTVARGALEEDAVVRTGVSGGVPVDRSPIPIDEELLARGGERYAIYCAPCHADDGSGESMLKERAGVATTDLLQDRLTAVSDGYLFDVITNGFGLMPSYAYPIPPRDRWAIIAWIRLLQQERGGDAALPVEATAEAAGEAAPVAESAEAAPGADATADDGEETP